MKGFHSDLCYDKRLLKSDLCYDERLLNSDLCYDKRLPFWLLFWLLEYTLNHSITNCDLVHTFSPMGVLFDLSILILGEMRRHLAYKLSCSCSRSIHPLSGNILHVKGLRRIFGSAAILRHLLQDSCSLHRIRRPPRIYPPDSYVPSAFFSLVMQETILSWGLLL